MQLDKSEFIHYDMADLAEKTFKMCFGDDIELQKFDYSNTAMGWFVLEYEYKPKKYRIIFENDRLVFSIRIIDIDDYHTSLNQMMNKMKPDNALNKENVKKAIECLVTAIEKKDICFYISKDGKQYKKEDGKITRIKYPFMS